MNQLDDKGYKHGYWEFYSSDGKINEKEFYL